MFDDYQYKNQGKRVSIRFVQERDETMYPWEIAGFLNNINTVYYKFELLNSISSAIKEGIDPSNIFIFDKSLPLYKRYGDMDVLEESHAAERFYPIGLPYPLFPNADVYEYNLLYQVFYTINSFLLKNHVRPLAIKNIAGAYEIMRAESLNEAETYIIDLAEERAKKSFDKSNKEDKKLVTKDQIINSLDKYKSRKEKLLTDLSYINNLNEDECLEIIESDKRNDKNISKVLLTFFRYFNQTSRPLVCARVAEGKFRVLGRSLVNKRVKAGLEVRDVIKRSPLVAAFECGLAVLQVLTGETRSSELHQLEIKKKKIEIEKEKIGIEIEKEKLTGEKLKNFKLTLDIQKEWDTAAASSDIHAIDTVPDTYIKKALYKAYGIENRNAVAMLNNKGLSPDQQSVIIIDCKV